MPSYCAHFYDCDSLGASGLSFLFPGSAVAKLVFLRIISRNFYVCKRGSLRLDLFPSKEKKDCRTTPVRAREGTSDSKSNIMNVNEEVEEPNSGPASLGIFCWNGLTS